MMYLLDTDIASYYLRGKYQLEAVFHQKGESVIRMSVVTVAELRVLAYKNPQAIIRLAAIDQLARRVGILEADNASWERFSQMKAEALKRGKTVGDFDILQASIADEHSMVVVTHNIEHYQDLVRCEDWTTSSR